MKICGKCKDNKTLESFNNDKSRTDGLNSICKTCCRLKYLTNREINIQKSIKNRNLKSLEYKTVRQIRYNTNKKNILAKNKIYLIQNKSRFKDYYKTYQKNWHKIKRNNDFIFKFKGIVRNSINNSFRRNGFTKNSKTQEILDSTYQEFKNYLESKFESWMNWDNHGLYNGELNYGWDIDHIIPLSTATTKEDVIRLNHFTNLQPLCGKINRDIKRNNIYE